MLASPRPVPFLRSIRLPLLACTVFFSLLVTLLSPYIFKWAAAPQSKLHNGRKEEMSRRAPCARPSWFVRGREAWQSGNSFASRPCIVFDLVDRRSCLALAPFSPSPRQNPEQVDPLAISSGAFLPLRRRRRSPAVFLFLRHPIHTHLYSCSCTPPTPRVLGPRKKRSVRGRSIPIDASG